MHVLVVEDTPEVVAGWEERGERIREREALQSLRSELNENIEESDAYLDVHEGYEQNARELLDILDGRSPRPDTKVLDDLIRRLFTMRTFEASTGVTDGLLTSGELAVFRRRELREGVSSLAKRLEDALEDQSRATQLSDLTLSFLSDRYPLRRSLGPFLPFFGAEDLPPGGRPPDYGSILQEQEFENLVVMKIYNEVGIARDFLLLRDAYVNLLVMVDAELALGP